MSLTPRVLNFDQIFALVDAFGLAGDCLGLSAEEWDDILVAPIILCEGDKCFVYRTYDDKVYDGTRSVVVCHDGKLVPEDNEWTPVKPDGRVDWHGNPMQWVYTYFVGGASYVATEVRGAPERLFIYENSPKLDVVRMCRELREYRLAHPPRIFPDGELTFHAASPVVSPPSRV